MKCKQLTGKLFTTVYDKECAHTHVCGCARACACVYVCEGKGAALPAPQARSCVVM